MEELEAVKIDLLNDLGLGSDYTNEAILTLQNGQSRYLKDFRINLKNALKSTTINEEEIVLLGVALAANVKNRALLNFFKQQTSELKIESEKVAEAVACASLLSSNNVFYRFRHFVGKEEYQKLPARIKMNIMMKPVVGKEFFELLSLAISAVNGCEMCVNAHEDSLIKMGTSEARIFDSIRLASVINSADRLFWD
jgi:alkyl hydroperoxide reductase subunit D